MYKKLGIANIFFGLLAIAYSLYLALFLDVSYAVATSYQYSKVAEAYEVARVYSNLRFFTVLTIGLSGIFFGYKAVEIKAFEKIPFVVHWSFFACSIALDVLAVVGIFSDIRLRV